MKNGEYDSVEQMDTDLGMMLENAKRYNMPNSGIYKRAVRLQQIMQVRLSCCILFADSKGDLLSNEKKCSVLWTTK